jgi:hypothetical protein
VSSQINLAAGAPARLTITTQPSPGGASGIALATQPVIQIRDLAGNPIAQGGTNITASIQSGPAGSTLGGTNPVQTNGTGTATFTNLTITGASGNYVLRFSAPGLAPADSDPITLGAGSGTQLTFNQQPSVAANSGQPFAQQPILLLRDAANNPVAGGVVTAAVTGAPAGVTVGSATATTNAAGIATFAGLRLTGLVGSYTLTFTSGAATSAPSNTIVLSAGTPTQLTYSQQPGNAASSGQAFATQPILLLRDASNNPVPGVAVTAAIGAGSPAGSLFGTATATTNAAGLASFAGSGLGISGPIGSYTLTFSAGAVTSAASDAIVLSAGTATQLTYSTQPPAAASSGVAFGTVPVLLLRDAANNPVAGTVITATITGSPAGVSLVGSATATTNSGGLATFTGLGLSGPTGSYTLTFTAGALSSPVSNSIALSAGGGTQLSYQTQPASTANSGQALSTQPSLLLRDASNNPVPGILVTAAITGSPAGVNLIGGATTTTNASGVATFSTLGLSGTVGSYTLTFSTGTATSPASNAITLNPGTPTQLTYQTQPPGAAVSGSAFSTAPVLLLRDAANNPVSGVLVTAAITSSPPGVAFVGTTTATTNGSGLATFGTLGLSGTAGSYTLTFGAGAVTSPASNTIVLSAGGGTQLTYTLQPSGTATSGMAFVQQPVLLLRDASNNPVPGVLVTAAITGAPPGASLIGTTSATTDASGLADFAGSGLGLSALVGNYTLTFTTGTATSVASSTIAVSAGSATQLSYSTQPPANANSGQAFATAPVLLLRDAANNPVAGVVVTATITGTPAGVSFVGSTTATTGGTGLATFTGLGLSGPAGSYTLTFTAGAVTSPASNSIALAAGGGTQLSITTQPSAAANSGQAFAQQPELLLLDASNNPVAGAVVTAAITGSPPGTALVGTVTATTNGAGVASFNGSGLGIQAPVGSYTLTFTSGAATSSPSNTIVLSAGSATQLSYQTQPSTSATNGVAFGTQPVLLLRDAANNPVSGAQVTATITGSPPGVAFVGTTTATTDGSGLAAFTGLGLSGPAGTYSLTFTANAGAVSSPASNNITLGAGGGTQLTYNQQPSTSAQSGVAFAQQPILLLRDASNNPVPGILVTATITGAPAGASLMGTTAITTDASGVASFVGSGLGLSALTGNYTLTFSTGTATSVASNAITLATGPPSQLTYSAQPSSSATSGQPFATQPILLLRDSGNNPIGGR